MHTVYECSSSNLPIFAIYDDTIAEKTRPSSKAKSAIQETSTSYYYAFLRKTILPYAIERYKKGEKSKIEMVCEIVESLPSPKGAAYGLCDSWFTNKKVINAHFKKGYHLIGALKTNRVIYPKGIGIQIKQFTQYIEKDDVCLVTVNKWLGTFRLS